MKKLFIAMTFLFSINSFALPVPPLTGPVVDNANVLNNDSALEAQIRSLYNNGQGPQINILTISSLDGDNLEQYAHKVFTTWKLGDAKRDDGVLFLVVINDRQMRIEVGQGLEGGLTDLQSKRILSSLKSYFRTKDYNGGIQSGLNQIIKTVSQPDAVQQPVTPRQAPTNDTSYSQTSSGDGGLFFGILVSAIIALTGFLIIGRIITNYKRKYNKEYSDEQYGLHYAENQETQALKAIQKYTDKIESAEKAHHLPLAEAKKKLSQEIKLLSASSQKQDGLLDSLQKQALNCSMAQMESLKRTKNSLTNELNIIQRNIAQHENLINKEGK